MASKEKKRFFINMLIMTSAMFVIRIMGMMFNIYFTSVIGATETGMYHLIFSAYGFFVTFSVAGCGIAATRLVSESAGCVNAASKAVSKCISVCLPTSAAATAVAVLMRNSSVFDINGAGTASVAIGVLAMSLVPTAIQSVYRGYFMAVRNIATVTVSQLLEETSQIIITLLLLQRLKGTPYAYISLIAGISLGAYISCLFDFCAYRKYTVPNYIYCDNSYIKCRTVTKIAFPIAAGSLLRSFLVLAENMLVPKTLMANGVADALGEYGIIKGMSIPLMMFPSVITTSLSSMLVTELSERSSRRRVNGIKYIAGMGCEYTMYYALCVCGAILLWHTQISDMFYSDKRVGIYLGILALLVVPMYLDHVVDGMLKGLNQQISSLKYNISDSVLRVVLILCLIPYVGSIGYVAMLYISELFNLFLSFSRLAKVSGIQFKFNYIFRPVVCTAFAVCAVRLLELSFVWEAAVYLGVYCTSVFVLTKLTAID